MAAEIAQLGERVTEDHKVPGSIPGFGTEHPAACPFLTMFFQMSTSSKNIAAKLIRAIIRIRKGLNK